MSSVRTTDRPIRPADPQPTSVAEKLSMKSSRPMPAKQVRLKLVYIDFWSAVKLSFLISAVLGVVLVVAVLLIWTVLASTGIFEQVSSIVQDVSDNQQFSVSSVLSFAQVMGFSLIIAALNVIVGTVLGAIACLLYNLSVRVTGGILVGFTNQ